MKFRIFTSTSWIFFVITSTTIQTIHWLVLFNVVVYYTLSLLLLLWSYIYFINGFIPLYDNVFAFDWFPFVYVCFYNKFCVINSQFVASNYPQLKSFSPSFPILIRESANAQPKITARFGMNFTYIIFFFFLCV